MELKPAVLAIAVLCLALPRAALSQRAPPPVADTPAPAPAPHHVNLTDLLSLAGPYGTFLDYLVRTDVIRTLQSQANATYDGQGEGVTVFAPEDSAFAAVDGAALSNLTADQLRALMLCHAVPRYQPLSSFAALAASGPVPTFGAQCAVNVTYAAGRIRVASGWTRAAKLVSSVYSTPPVAVYALDRVLLPGQVFPTEPAVAPVPAPAPAPAARGVVHAELSPCVLPMALRSSFHACDMRCAVALLATVMSVSILHAGAHRPLTLERTDTWPPTPQAKSANLTAILSLDGPFRTFLGYLQQTNLVEVFQNQAYLTDQGITIFVPVDRAFAAVKPSVLSGLSRHQLKNLMMCHSLAKHYELADFEGLSRIGPVTTLAGGLYTVNVTYDAGTVHVRSRWADAKVVGSVSVDAPMAIYELDRVLLPDSLFHARPPVAAIPDAPAAPPPTNEDAAETPATEPDPVAPRQYDSPPGVADAPISSCGAGDRFVRRAATAALGAMALLAS
ncbi:Fasciclin-like arabinogalactan protein 7 [Dichanthelium oligosanthes]|uniref:Fasciclin-like arabinogalactan protein 7 n=1 Tax=Dichanthelium oligosanthes TaxID=888268 RepID=A0A1E5WHA1_9POAL|nr:Fasciclin-like arabinogalactan protein 7 [Dichanthelium oligosanthes]